MSGVKIIVEEAVLLIPEGHGRVSGIVHGEGDVDVVFPKFAGQVFVDGIAFGETQGDGKHAFGEGGHPTGAVGLSEQITGRKVVAVEGPDIVHAEKAALEDIAAEGVFTVDPPSKVEKHFLEYASRKA